MVLQGSRSARDRGRKRVAHDRHSAARRADARCAMRDRKPAMRTARYCPASPRHPERRRYVRSSAARTTDPALLSFWGLPRDTHSPITAGSRVTFGLGERLVGVVTAEQAHRRRDQRRVKCRGTRCVYRSVHNPETAAGRHRECPASSLHLVVSRLRVPSRCRPTPVASSLQAISSPCRRRKPIVSQPCLIASVASHR